MRKVLMSALVALFLIGCSNNTTEEVTPDKLFKNEIARALSLENVSGKKLMSNMTSDEVVSIVNNIMKNESLSDIYANYGVETQGIGTGADGNKVFCYKLPVEFSFDGDKEEITEFIEELEGVPSRVSVSRFDITDKDGSFHVESIVNFLGDMESTSISSSSGAVNFKKNDVEVNEKKETVLRDFDVNLTLRPSNSDSSAVAIGVKNGSKVLFSDGNSKHEIKVNFSNQNGKYYAEYSVDGESRTESFSPGSDIKFDVLSCERVLDEDCIDVDLTINNSSGKKVSVVIYDDFGDRVKVFNKSSNVTVVNK